MMAMISGFLAKEFSMTFREYLALFIVWILTGAFCYIYGKISAGKDGEEA